MALVPATSVGSGGAGGGGAVTQISDSTLGGSAASFDLTSIPQTYNHLMIVAYLRGDTAAAGVQVLMQVNGDTGATYSSQTVDASAATVTAAESITSTSARAGRAAANTAPANSFTHLDIMLANYAQASNNKVWRAVASSRETAVGGGIVIENCSGQYFSGSIAAITRLTIFPFAGNFVAGSRVTLYGLT